MIDTRRREFITLLGGAAAWPLAAHAQQGERVRRVGLLIANYAQTDREGRANVATFVDAFQRLGWSDGRNARIEYRWSAGDPERARLAAMDLVRSGPDVIVVTTIPGLAELQKLTRTIPIVFTQVGDPVESGFVTSLARPGGNITGFQAFEPTMGGKWLGVLKEAQPNLSRAATLGFPFRDWAGPYLQSQRAKGAASLSQEGI
jgi:putative ABC transport system substrate-binding protein